MKYILLSLALLSTACMKQPHSTSQTNNPEFQVQLLFEHDGCKVYRFVDYHYSYFTNCKGSTEWTEPCGKNCRRSNGVAGRK